MSYWDWFPIFLYLAYVPALLFFPQHLWCWATASGYDDTKILNREKEYLQRSWLHKIELGLEEGICYFIFFIVFPFGILATTSTVYLVYVMITWFDFTFELTTTRIIILSTISFLIFGPIVVRMLRTRTRKREKMMAKLGQENSL